MNKRETLLALLALGAAPFTAEAQLPAKIPRIGVLESSASEIGLEAFRRGLRERGYVEGKNIVLEYRRPNAIGEYPKLAAELVRLNVDVIFAANTPAALAGRDATSTIPIVFATVADPVGVRLISSLPRPGANITGLTTNNVEVTGKRLEILKEISGGKVSRVAVLFNPADPSNVQALRAYEDAAARLGITLRPFPVKGAEDFEAAFTTMSSERIGSLLVVTGVLTATHGRRIVELAAKNRVPTIYGQREFVDGGGLVSYAASFTDNYRRAATYVDKILKGAMPGDLPVEQASTFEFVINLKTAKALGLTFPQSVLLRATQVIE